MVRRIAIDDAYALIALLFGLFFVIATPPFGTGDETAHFERAYEVATGEFLGGEGLPAGMQALIADAFARVKSGERVSAADYRRWSGIDLDADEVTPYPEPLRAVLRLHSPLCYLHLAPVLAVGVTMRAEPFWIFYAGRLAALLVGVALVRAAIGRAPATFRAPLAFLALLPTAVVFFAAFNIESLLVGLAFYYFALVAAYAVEPKQLARGDIARLAVVAFLLGQFKTAYLLLPAFALVLPASKFAGRRAQVLILTLIILPGLVASLGWATLVKDAMLGDIAYSTLNGNRVEPSAQLAGVLADPVGYMGVLWRTLFASDAPDFALKSFLALGGWTNIPAPAFVYALLTAGLLLVLLSGKPAPKPLTTPFAIACQLTIFAATALAILTLVYFQWNGVGDPTIVGFQGRYLIAVAPLLLALAPVRMSILSRGARRAALALCIPSLGLAAMAGAVLARYW